MNGNVAVDSSQRKVAIAVRVAGMMGLLFHAPTLTAAPAAPQVDLLIEGGEVYSGALEAPKIRDVGIRGDKIVFVGDAAAARVRAKKVLDARGMMVSPGFIDLHVHAESELTSPDPQKRLMLRQLTQGVTTSIIGVDGWGKPEIGQFRDTVTAAGAGNNFASYVGFGALRTRVLGEDARKPNDSELAAMKSLTAKAMCEGALGLSTGLFYAPQSFASTEEVIAVAKEAGLRGGLYDTHQRDEGTTSVGIVTSVKEQIRIGRESGAPLHLAHFKVSSGNQPVAELIDLINAARAEGQPVTSDQYPWSASNGGLVAVAIPRWAQDGGRPAMLKRFANPEDRARIEKEATQFLVERGGPQNILITNATEQPEVVGKRLSEIANDWGVSPAEAAIRLLEKGNPRSANFAIKEADIQVIMKQPWNMISSDGSPDGHPRGHASYPRLYTEYVQKGVITTTEFVYKATGLPATTLGLDRRGFIRDDYYADIVVIDLKNYKPQATFSEPTLLSTGVVDAVVNGNLVLADGKPTGALPGRGLAKQAKAGTCPM